MSIEAQRAMPGFQSKLPKEVNTQDYQRMLNSGDYIEIIHYGKKEENKQLLKSKYHFNNDIHRYGQGYYFSLKDSASTGYGDSFVKALIKKSDLIDTKDIKSEYLHSAVKKYIGNGIMNNGKKMDESYETSLYSPSTYAASKGKAVSHITSPTTGIIVVNNRGMLIVEKSSSKK